MNNNTNNISSKFIHIEQPSSQNNHQRYIKRDDSYSNTRCSPDQQLHVSQKWETPGNAMNHPKTNAYPKHYEIGDHEIILGAISPKPQHPARWTNLLAIRTMRLSSYYSSHWGGQLSKRHDRGHIWALCPATSADPNLTHSEQRVWYQTLWCSWMATSVATSPVQPHPQ